MLLLIFLCGFNVNRSTINSFPEIKIMTDRNSMVLFCFFIFRFIVSAVKQVSNFMFSLKSSFFCETYFFVFQMKSLVPLGRMGEAAGWF